MTKPKQLAPVISILNMKGGVGKTTITAHLFKHLFDRLHKSVLLIDFDPQFNLSQTLLPRARYEAQKAAGKTILSVMEPNKSPSLFSITTALGPAPNVADIETKMLIYKVSGETAFGLVAGDFGLAKYSLVEDHRTLLPIRERFLEFVNAARQKYDLVCIDCNPSSSFMTLCALMGTTHLLIPVRPDRYSILGLELLDQFIDSLPILSTRPKKMVLINGIPTSKYDPNVENSLRNNAKYGPLTFASTLKMSSLLSAKDGTTGFATDKRVAHVNALKSRLNRIVDELKSNLGW